MPAKARIAIIGAGPAGLMAAEVLSRYDYEIQVFEQKPSAARKFLMAGKTGLNISHAEDFSQFIQRYDQPQWLTPWIQRWDAQWIKNWMQGLGIQSYVGSSGRIFPQEMKAAPLLRAWLKRLAEHGVQFHYRHQWCGIEQDQLKFRDHSQYPAMERLLSFDAIVLACGAVSWPQLGSDGAWQSFIAADAIQPFSPSNVGVVKRWSNFMQPLFGQPLKRVAAWVNPAQKSIGDIVVTHYGLESGLVYKQGRALREAQSQQQPMVLYLDLLPDLSVQQLQQKLQPSKKQSLSNVWRKAGLDQVKSAVLREIVPKAVWNDPVALALQIKNLPIELEKFRDIEEAISCAGGVRRDALTEQLQVKANAKLFCCGEMLDWDAPTGGYLLTACMATGRAAGHAVHDYLQQSAK